MSVLRPLLLVLSSVPCRAATFGTVVPHTQPLADLVIDEARKRLYVVNTYTSTVEVFATNVSPPRLTNSIKTDATPLSLALSPEKPPASPHYLYVACYDGSTLDIIDLTSANFSSVSKQLDAKPQGVAVGYNGIVLVSTVGTGTGGEVLIAYDPATARTQALAVAPQAPVAPALPPPNGIMYLAGKSRLQASQDGKLIVSIFRGQPRELPFAVTMLERHPLGSQAFIPLGHQPYLVVVAPAGEAPEPDTLRAFLAQPGQGVNYAKGLWHHPLLALNEISDFLVIDRSGPGNNCDEITLAEPRFLVLD